MVSLTGYITDSHLMFDVINNGASVNRKSDLERMYKHVKHAVWDDFCLFDIA